MRKTFLTLLSVVAMTMSAQYKSQVWSPDNGDGTFTNPVINADYSDPDVCVGASGEDFYLTASSFNCIPGLPILHSKDLVNWEIINYAIEALPPLERYNIPQHGNGVWAPSIRYNEHNQTYYIYWGDPDLGVFVVTAKDPAGKWSAPQCIIEGKGMIDTTPLWDEDGRCYLVNGWANSRCQFNSVLTVREMSADGMRQIGNPVIVFDGNGTPNRTAEGPKFYKREGWYWIMCPAGGVPVGHQPRHALQVTLRSLRVEGGARPGQDECQRSSPGRLGASEEWGRLVPAFPGQRGVWSCGMAGACDMERQLARHGTAHQGLLR